MKSGAQRLNRPRWVFEPQKRRRIGDARFIVRRNQLHRRLQILARIVEFVVAQPRCSHARNTAEPSARSLVDLQQAKATAGAVIFSVCAFSGRAGAVGRQLGPLGPDSGRCGSCCRGRRSCCRGCGGAWAGRLRGWSGSRCAGMADGMNAGCRVTVFSGGCWALGRRRQGGSRRRLGGGRHRLHADDTLDRQRLWAAFGGFQRIESAVDADHDPACLNFKQSQLGQIEPKLKPLNHLRKTEPAELVLSCIGGGALPSTTY